MPTDRDTGRVRGFAFMTMDSNEAMNSAIEGIHGQDFGGRTLKVNEAQPR
jgi:RNA recognition motif-containing protein